MATEPRRKRASSVFLGAQQLRGPGRAPGASRVALVLSLCTLSTPAAAQWLDESGPVRATDEAPPPPPPSAATPASPAPTAPPTTTAPDGTPPTGAGPAPQAAPSAPAAAPATPASPAATASAPPTPPAGSSAPPSPPAPANGAANAPEASWPVRLRAAFSAEVAFGQQGRFRNYLIGPRLDLRFSERTAVGYSLRYANLEGPGDRAHNALHTISLEHRLFASEGAGFAVPLRLTGGYLPNNGPFLQGAVGAGYVNDSLEILALPVMPTFWNTGNRTWISYDLALEVAIRF